MLLDDLAADVVGDGLRHRILIALDAGRQVVDRLGDAAFHNQVEQANLAKVGNWSGRVGLNVRVDEVAHVGLVRLEVDGFAAGLPDDFPQLEVAIDALLDARNLGSL